MKTQPILTNRKKRALFPSTQNLSVKELYLAELPFALEKTVRAES